jgi:uncharacterized protein YxjI
MERLSSIDTLVVSQKKEWLEITTGFEQRNRYAVMDSTGAALYVAVENEGSFLARWFLKAQRPFEMSVLTRESGSGPALGAHPVLQFKRPFRFYFHELKVLDGNGTLLGTIRRRFGIIRRHYSVFDATEREIFRLLGPLLHPWTFRIQKDETECGKIVKKWSGVLKEGFTDADNFAVTFPPHWDIRQKGLCLGAVFLIDFVHFEK